MSLKNRLVPSIIGRNTRARSTVLAVVAGAAVFAFPSASLAAGDTYSILCTESWTSCQTGAQVWEVIGEDKCKVESYHTTEVCIDYASDTVYVLDGEADGHSALATVHAANGSVTFRVCRNPYGQATWVKCNFNWAEDGNHIVGGGIRISYDDFDLHTMWEFANN